VYVVAQDSAGAWQSQSAPTASKTWTVNSAIAGRVRINEVIADNQTVLDNAGTRPDVIELYNDGTSAIDLSDYSVTDNPASPRKYVFPAGTTLAAGQYLLLYADSATAAPGTHLGFSLSSDGEGVYLYNRPASGGAVVDSVAFGMQLTDYSIGRVGDGSSWALTKPTFGAANLAAPIGDPATLKLNEWQASGVAPFTADYVELYNPDSLPVALGGLSITDRAAGFPNKHVFAPLSFAPAKGFLKLTADNDTAAGANHLAFQLDADRGEIALLDSTRKLIDFVFYGPQSTGVAEGLSPNGSDAYSFFAQPNPGVTNPGTAPRQPVPVTYLKVDDIWNYNRTDLFADTAWAQPGAPSTGNWLPGPGLIYFEDATLPWPKNTAITAYDNTHIPYYFRRTFSVADPAAVTSLTLTALIDDGAIFYLNGQEIPGARYNMPAGAVTFSTQASNSISNATTLQTFAIPVSMLVAGDNVLAVEVHQNFNGGTSSSDVVFGVTLDATVYPDEPPPSTPAPLRVTELMYNPPGSPAISGDEYEFVELQNTGTTPLDLTGFRFTAGIDFTFGGLVLAPGGKTVIVKNLAAFRARYGNTIPVAGQYLDALDNTGETLRLEDAQGQLVQEFTYAAAWQPTAGQGDSLVINDPAAAHPATWNAAAAWHASTAALGTPGLDESAAPAPQHAVVVNELQANSPAGAQDWIELRNTTAAPIDISGWYLSDSADNLLKYRLPAGTILPANGFLVFDEWSTFGSSGAGAIAFSLSSAGEDVYVSSATAAGVLGAYREAAHFGASATGITLGRHTTSTGRTDFVPLAEPTRGAANAQALVGPVVINEIMYHPGGGGSGDEWIELRNLTASPVALGDWRFTAGVNFTFPAGASLAPGAFALVIPDTLTPAEFRAKYAIPASVPIFGGYAGALDNAGEHLELSRPGQPATAGGATPWIVVDDVGYGTETPWPSAADGAGPSLARFVATHYGNDVANWRASATVGGTPGAPNGVSPLTATGEFVEVAAHRLLFKFSKDVSATFDVADLQLVNLTTGLTIDPATIAVTFDPASDIATFTFPGQPDQRLPIGRYRATLLAGGVSAGGVALDGNANGTPGDNYAFDFLHLPGDMNGDGRVNFTDYQLLERSYGRTNATWADGDWNYDGVVNDPDTVILLRAINTVLPDAPPMPAQPEPAPVQVVVPAPTPVPVTTTPKPTTTAPKPPAKPAKPPLPKNVKKAPPSIAPAAAPTPFGAKRITTRAALAPVWR
jgi:hypothetical protein